VVLIVTGKRNTVVRSEDIIIVKPDIREEEGIGEFDKEEEEEQGQLEEQKQ
jgi:hypothetical protein